MQLSSFFGTLAMSDLVKSTLGPTSMSKVLQSTSTNKVNVTNNSATILEAIQLDNTVAKIFMSISQVQDDEVGNEMTSVAILAVELLRQAEKLIA